MHGVGALCRTQDHLPWFAHRCGFSSLSAAYAFCCCRLLLALLVVGVCAVLLVLCVCFLCSVTVYKYIPVFCPVCFVPCTVASAAER